MGEHATAAGAAGRGRCHRGRCGAGLLSARGHEVVHAGHALAALREISAGDFDVGLLDLDLPGLSGFELAQHLRNQGYMLPLLAVTARTDPDLQQQVEARHRRLPAQAGDR